MQRIILVLMSFFMFSLNAYSVNTYFGVLNDSKTTLKTIQKDAERLGLRVAVKINDILILKSKEQVNSEGFDSKLFNIYQNQNHLLSSLNNPSLIEQLQNWEVSEQIIEESELFSHSNNCDGQCGCIDNLEESSIENSTTTSKFSETLSSNGKRILMCYGNPWVLCDTNSWQTVLKNIDIVKIYVGDINDRVDQVQAECFIRALIENDIKIAVEIGGLLDWHADKGNRAGEASFQQDLASLTPIINMIKSIDPNRNIDMLDLDGPIRRMLFPNNKKQNYHTINSAVTELFKVLNFWKTEIPDIEVNLLTNFPNWAWGNTPAYFSIDGERDGYGSYQVVLNEIRSRIRDGRANFDALTIDNPYDYLMGTAQTNQPDLIKDVDWLDRLLELERNARVLRMNVNMIFNTNGARNDSAYKAQTIAFIEKYRDAGGRPDGYWIQSWYDKPAKWIPEDENNTMTNIVKEALPYVQIIDINPNRTSDFMRGTSTVALFFVNNSNAAEMGVPAWDISKQNSVLANIAMNLAWWTDVADNFGVLKSFQIETYGYDHPAVQMDFDPTEGYTGIGSNNSKFQLPIMEYFGLRGTNPVMNIREFSHNLRTEKETDWAFCAFLLEGAGNVRAHASLQGPSTVLTRGSSGSGFTFAHEVGHIYGAYDEYWEAGQTFRASQSRYGVINGNFHWRNFPVQPSMMASSFSGGISYYTAVHLGLTDKVKFTRIIPTPEDAIYQVSYSNHSGSFLTPTRYQGIVDFHWGEGMQIRLTALDNASFGGKEWIGPNWSVGDRNEVVITKEKDLPNEIHLSYTQTENISNEVVKYLHLGNATASPDIYTVAYANGIFGFGGMRGISVWNGEERTILDFETGPNTSIPRDSRASAVNGNGDMFFATIEGDVYEWSEGETKTYSATSASFRMIAATNDGTIWTAVGADTRGRGEEMSPSGLYYYAGGRFAIMRTSNSNIPSDYVSGLALNHNGNLLVSFLGSNNQLSGLFEYDYVQRTWSDLSSIIPDNQITKLKQSGNKVIAYHGKGFSIIGENNVVNFAPNLPINTIVFDFTSDIYDNIYFATNTGVYSFDSENNLNGTLNVSNSKIPANFVYSIAIIENNNLVIGTMNGVAVIKQNLTTSVEIVEENNLSRRIPVFPNPASDYVHINVLEEQLEHIIDRRMLICGNEESYEVKIYNTFGECLINQTYLSTGGLVDISHLSPGVYFVKFMDIIEKFVVVR